MPKPSQVPDAVGLDLAPTTLVKEPIGKQQMVEIAKALSINARVLIMDEPTSSLSQRETENLFEVVHDLRPRRQHRLHFPPTRRGQGTGRPRHCFRDGENAGELAREEISHDAMVSMMVGRDLSAFYQPNP